MQKSRRLIWPVLFALTLLSLAAACTSMEEARKKDAAIPTPPPLDSPPFIFHRVIAGETLADIARWYAGDEAMAGRLLEENPDLNPAGVRPGDIVKVPLFLAVAHHEQPDHSTQLQKPVKKVRKKSLKKRPSPARQPAGDTPEIFGPK